MLSSKILACCAVAAAAIVPSDAFSSGALPFQRSCNNGNKCTVKMQASDLAVSSSVADVLARAAAMSQAVASMRASFNQPSAKPVSTLTVTRESSPQDIQESVADILARAAAMSATRGLPPATSSVVSNGAPANPMLTSSNRPPVEGKSDVVSSGESVADILARAASMEGKRPVPAGPAPAPVASAVLSDENVADILSRASRMTSR